MIDSKPYLCRHCEKPLGETSGRLLFVGTVTILEAVLRCGTCGKKTTWRPTSKGANVTINVVERTDELISCYSIREF